MSDIFNQKTCSILVRHQQIPLLGALSGLPWGQSRSSLLISRSKVTAADNCLGSICLIIKHRFQYLIISWLTRGSLDKMVDILPMPSSNKTISPNSLLWRHNKRDGISNHQPHVYSTVYSGTVERKHQSSTSLAFVREIHQWPVNSPHKWPVMRKMFPFDDVIMFKRYLHIII